MFIRSKVLFRDFLRMAMPATVNDVSWGLAFSMYSVIIGQFLGTDMVAAYSFAGLMRNLGTILCFGVAFAFALPLILAMRERHLAAERRRPRISPEEAE